MLGLRQTAFLTLFLSCAIALVSADIQRVPTGGHRRWATGLGPNQQSQPPTKRLHAIGRRQLIPPPDPSSCDDQDYCDEPAPHHSPCDDSEYCDDPAPNQPSEPRFKARMAFPPLDTKGQDGPNHPKVPTKPNDPKEGTKPTDPKGSTIPTTGPISTKPDPKGKDDPKEPTDPKSPSKPTDPKEPTKPTDPKEPTKPTDPKNPVKVPATTYTLTAQDIAKDNSTALLNIGAIGNIAALGTFNSTSGIRWTPEVLEVGYVAKVNETNTVGGGYTINATHISVGAGIGFNGQGVSFSLLVDKKGPVTGNLGGNGFKCILSEGGSKATCTK